MVVKKILVTSALPYIHGIPHLGNLTGSILPADVYYKFLKLKNENAIFICGSDEHGAQIELEAIKKGVTPESIATQNHEIVKECLYRFGCTFDYYGRTHSEENKETTYEIFNSLYKNGYIVERVLNLPYCRGCKRFLPDRYIEGKCPLCGGMGRGDQCDSCGRLLNPEELKEPYCNICKGYEIEFRGTKHLFLNLSPLQERIEKWISANTHWPPNALNYSLEFLAKGLEQRCITRDLKWGFSVPLNKYEEKVFYVWFDAPIGYIGITKELARAQNKPEIWKEWWKNPNTKIVHFLGKDNILFHTIFWPAFLIGSESGYTLPYWIASYEFLTAKGVKFSKSRGVGLNIYSALELFPPDYWRYVLISILPETADSEFSWEIFQSLVNYELNDVLGNFVHRTLIFINKYFEGKIPEAGLFQEDEEEVINHLKEMVDKYSENCEKIKLREGLRCVFSIAKAGNIYLSKKEPWSLIKNNKKIASTCIYVCGNILRTLGILLYPFLPFTSKKIYEYMNLEESLLLINAKEFKLTPGHRIKENVQPLFFKISDRKIEELRKKFK